MTVKISSKVIYTIADSQYPSEKYDVEGIKGLEKHFEECLGGLVDLIDGESWSSNMSRSKLKFYESILKHLDRFKTIIELRESIDEIKRNIEE